MWRELSIVFFFAVLSGDRILNVAVHQHRLTIILSFCLKTEGISLLFLTGMYPGSWCTWGHRMILSVYSGFERGPVEWGNAEAEGQMLEIILWSLERS